MPSGKKEERGVALSRKAPRTPTTQPAKGHPQALYLCRLEKPTASLEAWFEAGLMKVFDEGQASINGQKMLPEGYRGCTKDSILVEASKSGVKIFPVRLDVGEVGADTGTRTLYHYTHRGSFDGFLQQWHQAQKSLSATQVSNLIFAHLAADYQEREHIATSVNPKGEPELCAIEPGRFDARRDIRKILFGGSNREGHSLHDTPWEEFADYCIAVRVPATACTPKASHNPEDTSMVIINQETLEALHRREEARRDLVRTRAEEEEAKKQRQEEERSKRAGCLSFLFGSGRAPDEYWDEQKVTERKKQLAPEGQEIIDRPKRQMDHFKKQLANSWTREHYIKVHEKQQHDARRHKEEERQRALKQAGEAARRAQEEAAAREPASEPSRRLTLRVAGGEQRVQKSASKKSLPQKEEDPPAAGAKAKLAAAPAQRNDAQAAALWKEYKRKEEESKEVARGALTRIKMQRAVATARAAHEFTGTRSASVREAAALEQAAAGEGSA